MNTDKRVLLIKSLVLSIMMSFYFTPLMAQNGNDEPSLTETLEMLSEDAAKSYLNPISSAFGADLNAGWFHRAPQAKRFGFDLEVGMVVMGALFDDASKSFSSSGDFRFRRAEAEALTKGIGLPNEINEALINEIISHDYTVNISGATIIGSSTDSITISFSGQAITFPNPNNPGTDTTVTISSNDIILPVAGFGDLANVSMLPLFAPQLSIGTIFGTQATFRYLPTTNINADLGEFSYFGFGVQHNPKVWFPIPVPFDFAVSYFTQTLKIGDLFKTKATAFGLNVSKELGISAINITPYAGLMLEQSKMRVQYDFTYDTPTGQETQKIDFEMEGENMSRLTLGLSVRFLLINLNADYNIGKYNSLSAGLTLRF